MAKKRLADSHSGSQMVGKSATRHCTRLAEQLTQYTYCGCNGFRLGEYLFVNDATCADGAQEYAVLRPTGDHYVQIESLTFSWTTQEQALQIIRRVVAGEFDHERYGSIDARRFQTPEDHGCCDLCA